MKPFKAKFNLIPNSTPLVFADGTSIYETIAETYRRHDKGYFILAPSGAGKTHYVTNQTRMDWIDGDDLWMMTNAHPEGEWWLESLDTIMAIDARCDVITQEAIRYGFRIIGASNNWLMPDAIVIPDRATHISWIEKREKNNYDGGATLERFAQVESHIAWILKWAEQGVPKFETVEAATEYLTKL